ncbi:MAG: sigma-54-dependent Fis family transcriptional regulator [Myxococcales bacterium]|nr:sigma-54-dependent Fis family transcriptional regulator [Myxococcales bacterium]
MTPHIIVVDDQPRMAQVMATALRRLDCRCTALEDGQAALDLLEREGADLVVTDQRMPGLDGTELMRRVHARWPDLPVILVTAHGDVRTAVEAMRQGAFDYVTKPFDNDELRALARRALDLSRLDRENRWLRQAVGERYGVDAVVAESEEGRATLDLVRRVAPAKATVLIEGETGTGKELVARLLHFWSDRVARPFVAVNCKAFARTLLESELFGHEKGAFTGAASVRPGCFERADGGTLFLDEIGEVDADFQAKLLRVVQEGEVLRVGGDVPRKVDVRVVCATHRDLRAEVDAGRFREDLYFRLRVIPVNLAPLRARRADVLPLARFFLTRHPDARGRVLSAEAEAALLAHPWPGNVRELQNAIERAVVLARGEAITPEDLLLEQPRRPLAEAADEGTLQDCLDRAAEARVKRALAAAGGARAEAARTLGVERTTLYRLMKRLGLE